MTWRLVRLPAAIVMERAKETGPTRPRNMVKMSTSLLSTWAWGEMPTERPTVAKAETDSKRASISELLDSVARTTPVLRMTSSAPSATTLSAL